MDDAIPKLTEDNKDKTRLETIDGMTQINHLSSDDIIANGDSVITVVESPSDKRISIDQPLSKLSRASMIDGLEITLHQEDLRSNKNRDTPSVNSLNMHENDRSWMKTVMIIRNDMRNYFGLSFANKWGFFSDYHMSTLIHQFSFWLDYPIGDHSLGKELNRRIFSAVVSTDGYYLYTGGYEIMKWNLLNHTLVKSWREDDPKIDSLSYHKSGLLISGSDNGIILVRNAVKNEELIHTLKGHTNYLSTMEINLDGTLLLSGSHDCTIRLWSLKSGECLRVFTGHTARINGVHFMDDSQIMSIAMDGSIRMWHPSIEESSQIITNDKLKKFRRMSINQNATILACAVCLSILIYSFPNMELIQVIPETAILCVFHPLKPNLLAIYDAHRQQIRMLDVSSGDITDISDHKLRMTLDLCFSPDGYRLMCPYYFGFYIQIWDISHLN